MQRVHLGLPVAVLCISALSSSMSLFAQAAASATPAESNTGRGIESVPADQLPDSPGEVWAKSQRPVVQQAPAPQAKSSQSSADAPDKNTQGDANTQDSNADKKPEQLQRPIGTAAAEAPKVSGITAAQPAGAAIAPAKQRRVLTLVLKVGAILGASAAIGTVVALSAATPSKPPGAR